MDLLNIDAITVTNLATRTGGCLNGKCPCCFRLLRNFSRVAASSKRERFPSFPVCANTIRTAPVKPTSRLESTPLTFPAPFTNFRFIHGAKCSDPSPCPTYRFCRPSGFSSLPALRPSCSHLNLRVNTHSSVTCSASAPPSSPPSVSPCLSPNPPASLAPHEDVYPLSRLSSGGTVFTNMPLLLVARLNGMQFRICPSRLIIRDLFAGDLVAVSGSTWHRSSALLPSVTRLSCSASFSSAALTPPDFSRAAQDARGAFPRPVLPWISPAICLSAAGSRTALLRALTCTPAAASSTRAVRPPVAAFSSAAATGTAAAAGTAGLRALALTQTGERTTAAGTDVRASHRASLACHLLHCRFLVSFRPVKRVHVSGRSGMPEADAAAGAAAILVAATPTALSTAPQETNSGVSKAGAKGARSRRRSTAADTRAGNATASAAKIRARLHLAAAGEVILAAKAAAAAERAVRAADARKGAARITVRAEGGAPKDEAVRTTLDSAAVTTAGKACERMFFHSAAGPRPAAASIPTHTRAVVAGNTASAKGGSSAAAAGAAASAPTSATGDGRQQTQQLPSQVPFTKKRGMNLKAGPYRRGRIFISPKEDPLEFVLSCLVVFVMLYTLYKLPRGEYLWERRKRVIRERLLKEYGLTEEDVEDVSDG